MANRSFQIILILSLIIVIIFQTKYMSEEEFPLYRVALDPGHGGLCLDPQALRGDRYDTLSNTYLDVFKEGASFHKIEERVIVYQIAEKVKKLLDLCAPGGDYSRFVEILKKYTDAVPERIYIKSILSRGPNLTEKEAENQADPNGPFRLFDYPSIHGMEKGRISRINTFRPHLVVSLHLASRAPREYLGMSAVITPPFSFLHKGLRYLRGQEQNADFFYNRPYRDWFCEDFLRGPFSWFLNDVSLYFSGYPLDNKRIIKMDEFKGYRFNMVQWIYGDGSGWENHAKHHLKNTRYSSDYRDVFLNGRFWDRERSIYENFRRSGGEEGYGGDNCYASNELIRYMILSLGKSGFAHRDLVLGKPYVSTWIMPLHINAINAFFEMGYLYRPRDRYMLTVKQEELAEGLAVGIYSLFTGLQLRESSFPDRPKGKSIDLEKYRITQDKSYFDIVMEKGGE